jgi:hypothetical protein
LRQFIFFNVRFFSRPRNTFQEAKTSPRIGTANSSENSRTKKESIMFAKLNNLISRTLVATVIPAAMTLGLAGNTFADVDWSAPAQVNQVQSSNSLTFSGTADNTAISLQMFFAGGTTVNGYITINGNQYSFVGCEADSVLNGVLTYGDSQVTFRGVGVGTSVNLEIPSLNTSVTLELVC